ncbi:MAG: SpoIIE family protein phosphatase [Bacteroidales bacterium]|nr:SpoIIE family protein phosphatase [Bacteroidales bacterium]
MAAKLKSFAGRLTRSVLLAMFLIMAIIAILVFITTTSGMFSASQEHFSDVHEKMNLSIANMMSRVEVAGQNIIDEINWHLEDPKQVETKLVQELQTNDHLMSFGIAFVEDFFPEKGKWYEPYASFQGDSVIVRNIGSASHDYFYSEWFQIGLSSPGGAWTNPYLDPDGAGEILCTYTLPVVKEPEGTVVGTMGIDVSLSRFQALVNDMDRRQNETGLVPVEPDETDLLIYSFVIGPLGDYIIHPDSERILKRSFNDFAPEKDPERYLALGEEMTSGKSGHMVVEIDGVNAEVYYAPLLQSGWSMGIVVPTDRIYLPGYLYGGLILFLMGLGLLTVFFICRSLIRKTSRPLMKLADSAGEVAKGNFGTELPKIKSNDEIRLLRDSFENMQSSLSKYVQELTDTTAQKVSMERELYLAREIQMSLIPKIWPAFPDRDDIDVYGSVSPAKVVGGDLFDFHIRDGKLFFCIGDVSGKGVPASLVMMLCCAMFRTLSSSNDSPDKILTSMNSSMSAKNENMMFVTLFIGVLDLATGELSYSNAGHNSPVLLSEGKPIFMDADPNVAIGIIPDWSYTLQKSSLKAGETLFLYTDGLTEATRSDSSLYGEARLHRVLSGITTDLSAQEIVAKVGGNVSLFVGDAEQSDDLTMLAIRMFPK